MPVPPIDTAIAEITAIPPKTAANITSASPDARPGPSFEATDRTSGPDGSYWYAQRMMDAVAPTAPMTTEATPSGFLVRPELW